MMSDDLVQERSLTAADLMEMTRAEGDNWKLSHVRRVLKLIELIGEGLVSDQTAVTIATYLHDWGAYPRIRQPGVDHALRSRQVAETLILPRMDLPETAVAIILETIEYHDYRDFREASKIRISYNTVIIAIGTLHPHYSASEATMSDTFLNLLARIYPADRLLLQPGQLAAYESDGLTAYRARPAAVVIPEAQDEVVETVRLCHRHEVPFVARGSGTSLSGGSVPVPEGVVIALNRLNRILKLDIQERLAVVEPGVINLNISRAVAAEGLYYAPDPSSQQICTIGGNVAFNSGGAHCLKYGMTSNHVLAIKAVLPDGEVVTLGNESVEGVGPDLVGLFVGSEGLFGVALEITVRLLPRPEAYQTVLAAYHSLEAAGNAVAAVVASGLLPGAIEMMDRLAIQAAEAAVQANYPPGAEAVLIVELEGEVDQVAAEYQWLQRLIADSGAYEVRVAQDEADRQRIWRGRKSAFSAVGRLSPDFIVQDGVVPRSRLGEALAEIQRLSRQYGIRVANVFHAGDGNLHPLILYDGREAGAFERAEELAGEILRLCIRFGGSITGEHGVGLEKRDYLAQMYGEAEMDLMWRLRCALDSRQIANRGKMFPSGEPPALRFTGLHPLEQAGVISRE